ncbi:ribosome biogenesis protein NSA1 [Fistulifera solaris]|uniref:Ribosome biogenesis protein NSA1 n=1 Tax=Fistulifera solaris TaxID=1519565 RepID=A0A1Z5JRY6_FISSO|nr:ribosome biogenesis protein NSA1 [Fistulifera solaris]|eukprot:GAX16793.1 ribosome biogenesis protein NSA1 [Fistulifera solaris]
MRIVTGDECGLLKECLPSLAKKKSAKTVDESKKSNIIVDEGIRRINNGERSCRRRGIVALTWTNTEEDREFSSLHLDGSVEVWERGHFDEDFGNYRFSRKFDNIFGDVVGDGGLDPMKRPLGFSQYSIEGKSMICAANTEGKVVLLDPTLENNQTANAVRSSFTVFQGSNNKSTKLGVTYPLASSMSVDEANHYVAMGGKERETVLWDLNTSQQVWKAKNLPPDAQTLLQPQVWPTAISFLKNSVFSNADGNIMAVGSAHNEVRIYDIRVKDAQAIRRPFAVTPFGLIEHRVTALCQSNAHTLVVGDAAGYLNAVDLRKLGKKARVKKSITTTVGSQGRFVGPVGSVQSVVKHYDSPVIAAVGLDRMLRVYDSENRKELACMYLKQRLKCVLVGRERMARGDDDSIVSENEGDIDQEDVVDDYVDSDLEGSVNENNEDDDDDDDGDDHSGSQDSQELSESESDIESEENSSASDDEDDAPPSGKRRKQ